MIKARAAAHAASRMMKRGKREEEDGGGGGEGGAAKKEGAREEWMLVPPSRMNLSQLSEVRSQKKHDTSILHMGYYVIGGVHKVVRY